MALVKIKWLKDHGDLLGTALLLGLLLVLFVVLSVTVTSEVPASLPPPMDDPDPVTYRAVGQLQFLGALIGAVTGGALAGAAVIASSFLTNRAQARTSEQTNAIQRETALLNRETHLTDRYTQAVLQLGAALESGAPNLEVRLGGIYALERLAKDSPRDTDHWTIMEVLTAYVRQNAPLAAPNTGPEQHKQDSEAHSAETQRVDFSPRTDIQAALTVIGRRDQSRDPHGQRLDLRRTNLSGAHLNGAHLSGADLSGAYLFVADLNGAHLNGADLNGADLSGAHLNGAHLSRAHLNGAHLSRAHLNGADLNGAHLFGAHLFGAFLPGAHLNGADLFGADLGVADLNGADLTHVVGLTREQLAASYRQGHGALLPAYLVEATSQPDQPPEATPEAGTTTQL